ncbi:MAG: hydroxyacylglutathione hydrolase [Polyangiaceae bacterium]|nr:hydroxyacylglutathione hydrolase [Polyangiaceae bacterium]
MSVPCPPFESRSGALEVHMIPAAQDNLVWLIVYAPGKAAAVDGPSAGPVLDYCAAHDLELTTVLNTHTHFDHIGLNHDLERRGQLAGLRVVGSATAPTSIPGLTQAVTDGEVVQLGEITGEAWLTEGHIDGHISYLFDGLLFSGDTLFAAGCGYLFDGPPEKMYRSLARLRALPPDTRVCCAHEYTQDNLRFAWSIEPQNQALATRIASTWATRARGESVVPSQLAEELATNPFLRFDQPAVIEAATRAFPERDLREPSQVFAATRALKDRKDYRALTDDDLPI